MKPQYRDLIKHSGVYGVGQILTRMASIVLLPLYTRYLTPSDYGTIAIMDLTAAVLSILVSGGFAPALTRYHFEAGDERGQQTVWWTGLAVVMALGALVVVPALALRHGLARWTLGPEVRGGGFFYSLVLITLWFGVLAQVPTLFLRVRKSSWLTVALSLVTLLLNIALNVYFLTVRHWGIAGILSGNLITIVVMSVVRLVMLVPAWGRFQFNRPLAVQLLRFSGPLVLTLLCATVMHQADRYLLRLFVDLDQVGIYALAYSMGQGLNSLFFLPFASIWAVVIYDLQKEPNPKETYVRIFEYYVYALLLLLLGVSLFVRPLLAIFATPEYAGAAALVPIVCLSFVFFSIDDHFRVPALLTKRTTMLIPANAIAAGANIALNLVLIPYYGAIAAAWVSVATYAIYAAIDLHLCRRIDRYEYPLLKCGLVLAGMVLSFVACQYVQAVRPGMVWSLLAPAALWTAWAAGLLWLVRGQYMNVQRLAEAS